MKNVLYYFLAILTLMSCQDQMGQVNINKVNITLDLVNVPQNYTDFSKLSYEQKTSIWTLNGLPYSGYARSFSQDSVMIEKFGILNGKKHKEATSWYTDGHLKRSAYYYKGKLHGVKKTWSADPAHVLVSQLNYYLGKAHGEQKKWYSTGEIFKILHLNMGKEEGIQQAFRKNGDLFANYEAREGRIFGLKRASLCFGLQNETIQHAK